MRRLHFAAFFARHFRAYLAAHWTVTVALAAVLFSAHQSTPATGSGLQPPPQVDSITCPTGQTMVQVWSGTSQTAVQISGATGDHCLVIVGAGFSH